MSSEAAGFGEVDLIYEDEAPADDRELIHMLTTELAAATGHTFRNATSRRLRALTRHDRRMADGSCLTCALLDIAEEAHQ